MYSQPSVQGFNDQSRFIKSEANYISKVRPVVTENVSASNEINSTNSNLLGTW